MNVSSNSGLSEDQYRKRLQQVNVPRFSDVFAALQPPLLFRGRVPLGILPASAKQTRVVVKHGAFQISVQLLQSPNDNMCEQALWALVNFAGDSPNFRDLA